MSDFPLDEGERLPYSLREQSADSGEIGAGEFNPAPFPFWPEDPDEEITVQVTLSLNQYVAIYSAIDIGAAIAYGDDSLLVKWFMWRNFGGDAMSFCAQMIECLLNDADTQEAIASLITSNEAIREALETMITTDPVINGYVTNIASNVAGQAIAQALLERNLLKPDACDNDYTFNQASELVRLLDSITNDLFEAVEVGTNRLERGELLVSAIPGVGIMPFDELLQLADDMVENISEDYAGAYDTALYDTIRCELWCAIKDNCRMSLNDAFTFYETKTTISIPSDPIQGLLGVLQFLDSGDFPGDTIVYGMHLLALAAIRAGQNVLGINFGQLGLRITAAGDDPDNDWETICDDCPEPDDGCVDYALNVQTSPVPGGYSGISAEKGDKVSVTATGYYQEYPGGPHIPANGNNAGPGADNYPAPYLNKNVWMTRVEGENWRALNDDGTLEWYPEVSGRVMTNANVYMWGGPPPDSTDAFGTIDFNICVIPGLWELVSCDRGLIEKISGPESGVGDYVFKFTSELDTDGSDNQIDVRWRNTAQKFVVTAITPTITGASGFGAGVGTPYHRAPGDDATCGEPSGLIVGLPVANGSTAYGGLAAITFNPYPFEILISITVSAI